MIQTTQWDNQLIHCATSSTTFSTVAPEILSLLQQDNPAYTKFFFNKISQVITCKQLSPQNRFYWLYLLFKATESGNLPSKSQLLQDETLLSFLYRAAIHDCFNKISLDERGRKFFAMQPSKLEAKLGVNFVRLCLECLINWKNDIDSQNNDYNTLSFFINLVERDVKLPKFYHFIGKNFALGQGLATWDYRVRTPKTVEEVLEEQEKAKIEQEPELIKKQSIIKPQLNEPSYQKRIDPFSRSGRAYTPSTSPVGSPISKAEGFRSPKFLTKKSEEKFSRDLMKINNSIGRSLYYWKPSPRIEYSVLKLEDICDEYSLADSCRKGQEMCVTMINKPNIMESEKNEIQNIDEQKKEEERVEMAKKARERRLRNLLNECRVEAR